MVVVYRKYRPKNFSDIVGQENIIQTLTNAISMGLVSHAYLFYGQRGTGKTSTARLLAKAMNCSQSKDFEPCNKCQSCLEVERGNAMDLIEIDAASNRGIDEMRALKEGINVAPTKSKYKLYIIDEAHQLTKEASNALLKTLEEPPAHVIFILCTTEFPKILPTIASRCQRFEFKKMGFKNLIKRLEIICKKEEVKIEKGALESIAMAAEGSIRDSESLLDEVINFQDKEITKKNVEDILGLVGIEPVFKLVNFLKDKNKKGAIEHLFKVSQSGTDIENFLKKLISYLRNLLLVKINSQILEGSNIFTKEEEEGIKTQEKEFEEVGLKEVLKIFLETQNQIKWSDNPQLLLELALMDSIEALNGGSFKNEADE